MTPPQTKRYIVSSRDLNRHQHLFHVTHNGVERIQTRLPEQTFEANGILIQRVPKALLQVREEIIDLLINTYLKQCNFELAFRLISLSSATIRRHYKKIYGHYLPRNRQQPFSKNLKIRQPPLSPMHIRLSRTIQFISDIYDSIAYLGNYTRVLYFALRTTIHIPEPEEIYPWDYAGPMEIIDTLKPEILGQPTYAAVSLGPYISDICWIAGYPRAGSIHSSFMRTPIINLILRDADDNLIPDAAYFQTHEEFKAFAELIRYCLGPHTGVFLTVHDAAVIKTLPLI